MARILIFDARFENSSGVGITVDTDIYADFFESGATIKKERRTLGNDQTVSIIQSSDAQGVFYTTSVDVSNYMPGDVRVQWFSKSSGTPVSPYPFEETLQYPTEDQITLEDIRDYVRTSLGFPVVAVELVGNNYRTIITEALSAYNQFLPYERAGNIDLVTGQQAYQLPNVPSRGPSRVTFVRKDQVPYFNDPFFGREFPRFGGAVEFDTFVLGNSYLESMLRVGSQEPEWRWYEPTKTLWIDIGGSTFTTGINNYYISYYYYDDVQLSQVRPNHFRWFRRYALSQAKKVLGRIRHKFQGEIPAPGGKMKLDGSDLLQEGQREEEALIEEARSMMHSIPPVLG